MTLITIALDDTQTKRLQQFAQARGQTPEQALQSLLNQVLPDIQGDESAHPTSPTLTSTLTLAGIIADPSIAPLSARDIDEILADEAASPHDEIGEHGGE